MYPVTNLYKDAIQKDNREFTCDITIEHSQGTLELTDDDLSMGSLTYTEATQSGDEYTIGSTVASDISFTIFNKPEYENIQFMGATVFVTIGLYVIEGIDAHFIQPSQPSAMKGFEDDIWEYVPLGRFNIDEVNVIGNTIQIKAIDNMINFDKPYSLSNLTYPATLQQIYVNICNVADVPVGTLNFPNMNYLVNNRPSDDLTLRDVLGYVAELSGTFAKCTRTGSVELRWYEPTDLELRPEHRYDFTPSDDVIQITGIVATVKGEEEEDDVIYISGSEGYTIDLTENLLLQGDYETVLPNIYNNVKDTVFTPYSSNSKGNPAIQAGDIIKQIDKNGKEYTTIITKSVYRYRGKSTLEAKGLSQISKGYKGSTNRRLAEIKHKVDVEIGDKLTNLEQAMLNATELITGQMGGHVLKREGELLIMDNPDPELAVKVWRWNLGGLGYSSSGVDGIYETAMTMDGSINAKFITTGSLSANIVQSGLLESQNGNSSINLDSGVLKLGNNDNDPLLYFNGNDSLTLGSGVSLTWGQIDNKPWIPQNASDIGAKPDDWVPTWTEIQNKPTILSADDIKTTVITKDWIGTLGLMVGDEIQMGPNAIITWDNLSEDSKENLKGEDGTEWSIGEDGYWYEDGVKTDKKAIGEDGYTPVKGVDYFDGVDGQDGEDGNGIVSTEVSYQISTSGTSIPTGTWYTTPQTPIMGRYLWTRTKFNYASGSPTYAYSVAYFAVDGSDATVPAYITATKITQTTIESPTITGGTITGGDVYLRNSNNVINAGMSSSGTASTSTRIWAGSNYANRASAPFRVQQDGKMIATNADISGKITSTNADISGKITSDEGQIGIFKILPGEIQARDTVGSTRWELRIGAPIAPEAGGGKSPFVLSNDGLMKAMIYSDGRIQGSTLISNKIVPSTYGDIGESNRRFKDIYLRNQPNVSSDVRQKNSIQDIPEGLIEKLKDLEPKMFKQNDAEDGLWHFGYIAQDVETVLYQYALEEVGYEDAQEYVKDFAFLHKDESYLSLLYGEIAVLREKEMRDRIASLELQIEELKGV